MLQEVRKKRGYTQSELANITGIPLQTIQKYECGYANINNANLRTLLKLCVALYCDLEDILTDKELIEILGVMYRE